MNEQQWNNVAKNYHEEIVSPFFGNVTNPLLTELKQIKDTNKKSVAEFGCGFFYLGKILSEQFKKVYGSDFAEEMVKKAKEHVQEYDNVTVKKEDVRKIKYKEEFDVIISVNSILMPSRQDRQSAFEGMCAALKKDGKLLMITPSMESILYHGLLLQEQEKDVQKAKKRFELQKYDLFLGLYKEGIEVQKFFYRHEIEYYLKKAGFTDITFKKVLYPWDKEISDYDQFPEEEPIWDWFVKARK